MSDSPIRLSLSTKGLQRLEGLNHERDFAFVVGDERYACPSFVAEFLSPRITSLRSQDITIHEFSIETADPNHYFETVLSLALGREVSLSGNALEFVRSVCGELWNSELFEMTLKQGEGEIMERELRTRIDFMSGVDGSCGCEVGVVASHFYELSVSDLDQLSPPVLESILSDPSLVLQDEDSLFEIVHRRASENLSYFGLLGMIRFEFLSDETMTRAAEFISSGFESFTFGIWSSLRTRLTLPVKLPSPVGRFFFPPFDSKIISSVPEIFSVLGHKKFRLLYRGSRDGFRSTDFHSRCDGHANTVTLISSTNDCIFGGYAAVAWNSQAAHVPDPTLKSFLFTIKNPHNLPPRIFKQRKQAYTIYPRDTYGPTFGDGHDIHVSDECHSSTGSYTRLGSAYTNDSGISESQVFTGDRHFTVEEIEVFEVL
jgi:hypothetical protein